MFSTMISMDELNDIAAHGMAGGVSGFIALQTWLTSSTNTKTSSIVLMSWLMT